MKTYKILTGTPIERGDLPPLWIEETSKCLFGLFLRRRVYDKYEYDEGGSLNTMPWFSREECEEKIKELKNENHI